MTRGSKIAGALQVLQREIRQARRDRNLVLQLVLIPAFLYPVMGFGGYQVYLVVEGAEEQKATVILADADVPAPIVNALDDQAGNRVVPTPPELDTRDQAPAPSRFRALRDAWTDEEPVPSAMIAWWTATGSEHDSVRVFYDSSRSRSAEAREEIEYLVRALQDSLVLERATLAGLTEADVDLWALEEESTASSRQMGSYILSLVLPLFLMIMLAQGTFYATLDTVVGERERGTLETILTSPLDRGQIVLGKFFFVVISSLVAFLLNLAGLLVFIAFLVDLLGMELAFGIEPLSMVMMVLAALLAAATLAAVMMLASIGAKSYREGQAVLMPAYMIASLSGVVVVATESPFTVGQALIPAINVVALLRALLRGDVPLVPAFVAYGELLVLAIVAMVFASRIASKEGVFFDPDVSLKRLLGLGKEPS